MKPTKPASTLKQQLAAEAARLLCNGDTHDLQQAKLKAAARLCPGLRAPMPDNRMVEQEMRRYRQFFAGKHHQQTRLALMRQAREAMVFLAVFQPRLMGSIVQDTATPDSSIDLLCHTEIPGEVGAFLDQNQIDYQSDSRLLGFSNDEDCLLPTYRFLAGEHPVQITEIPANLQHHRIVSGNLRQRVETWNRHRLEEALAKAEQSPA